MSAIAGNSIRMVQFHLTSELQAVWRNQREAVQLLCFTDGTDISVRNKEGSFLSLTHTSI
jgi:hypothetical protein